jgi:hypothetical protein
MPANIAHMVIVHKALKLLQDRGPDDLAAFAAKIDDAKSRKRNHYHRYANLGSLGPDLYYYASMAQSGKDMLTEGFVRTTGVTPWSYQLHSLTPSDFPLRLCQILFRDALRKNGAPDFKEDDWRKLAYVAGHLSHIAADQIIHPLVNRIAKPYYRSGANRKKHRQCEVFQDYFLYEEVYRVTREQQTRRRDRDRYDFFEQDFNRWVDCVTGIRTRNTEDWFRHFLQRGFVETYGASPTEDDIENSADNLLLVLRTCKLLGPYKKAAADYEKHGPKGTMYKEYVSKPKYAEHYADAVRLSAVYIAALFEAHTTLMAGEDFAEQRGRFLRIVSDADLSCPLRTDILNNAWEALADNKNRLAKYTPLMT